MVKANKESAYELMVNSTNLSESPIVKCDCRMSIYKYLAECQSINIWYLYPDKCGIVLVFV
jgi:hypothetical protein